MNGDLGKIYDSINEVRVDIKGISVLQKERHTENKNHLFNIDKALKKLETLPCKDIVPVRQDISRLYHWVWGIVILIIGLGARSIFFS